MLMLAPAVPQADKQTLFAACVARTVKGQLAFEPQARPELEATVARLDIDFAKHVRPPTRLMPDIGYRQPGLSGRASRGRNLPIDHRGS